VVFKYYAGQSTVLYASGSRTPSAFFGSLVHAKVWGTQLRPGSLDQVIEILSFYFNLIICFIFLDSISE